MAKAAVGTFDSDSASQAWGMLSGITQGSGESPVRGTKDILEHYSRMPWLRAVSSRIGDAIATDQWQLFVPKRPGARRAHRDKDLQRAPVLTRSSLIQDKLRRGELIRVPEHLLLDALNRSNSYQTGHSFRKVSQIHLDLAGETFWLKERNGVGAPMAFWPIPPNWIEETPTPEKRTFRVSFRAWQGEIPDTEIMWMADPNPANPFGRGTGMARTLSDELETDEFAAKFTKQVFVNNARPDFVVWPESGEISDPQRQTLRTEWLSQHQGFWRAFRPMFASRKIGLHEFKHDFKALQLIELREHERNSIIQVFGFPPEILGVIENANRSTIDAADYLFQKYVHLPRLEFLRTQMQERLIPEYDERLVLDYVSPVREDKELQDRAIQAMPYAFTLDEIRQRGGEDPLPDGKGVIHPVPSGMTFETDLENIEVDRSQRVEPATQPVAAGIGGRGGDRAGGPALSSDNT
jgi:HK97 family phage portal protein